MGGGSVEVVEWASLREVPKEKEAKVLATRLDEAEGEVISL